VSCKAIGQEVEFSLGFRPQADYVTPNTAGQILWDLPTNNRVPALSRVQDSTDAAMTGKAHEFAEETYKEAYLFDPFEMDVVTSAELLALATVFSYGSSVKSGTDPDLTYTCVPADRATDGCALDPITLVQKIRGGTLLDEAFPGCVVDGFALSLSSGPERANSNLRIRLAGTGNFVSPSTLTSGSRPTLTDLLSAHMSLGINIGGNVDYVTSTRINSLEFEWSNSALMRYYPGSGTKDGRAIAGTAQYTPGRMGRLSVSADFVGVTAEVAKVRAATEGTAEFGLTASATRSWITTLHRIRLGEYNFEEDERGINVTFDIPLLWHSSNGLLTTVAKCGVDNIGVAA
jgi:hypothetical protein